MITFSDKKTFTINPVVNKQNDTVRSYKDVIKTKTLPWIKEIVKKVDYVFMIGAPSHIAKIVQDYIQENIHF